MMKLKLNPTYQNTFITLHNGLILKKDEDWKEYEGKITTELKQYIYQRFIIVKEEVKGEESPKVEEKPKVEKEVEEPKVEKTKESKKEQPKVEEEF